MQKLIFILIVSALAVWIGNKATKNPIAMDDVVLKNLEALASGENGVPVVCRGFGEVACPLSSVKVGSVYEGYSLRP